jgi:hypothetical protein
LKHFTSDNKASYAAKRRFFYLFDFLF